MNNELFQRRLNLIKDCVLVLDPLMNKTHKNQLEHAILKASPTYGAPILNELEKLVLIIAQQYNKDDVATAILNLD